MKNTLLKVKSTKILVITAVGISLLLLLSWLFYDPTNDFYVYEPGMDHALDSNALAISEDVVIGEFFQQGVVLQSNLTGLWPHFRGVNHDNVVMTASPINENWKQKPLKILWSIETGEGHAAPAIYQGRAYFLDYDEEIRADVLKCVSLETGEELWRRWYHVQVKRNHGMSRTIPAVSSDFVVTMGPRCHVMCVDRLTGDFLWGIDLEKEYGTETPLWYTGQCPIIIDNTAIIAVGGKSLFIGVDCKTGEVLWETPNERNWKMSHSSILPVTINNRKMLVYPAIGGVAAISAEGDNQGDLLWEVSDWSPSVIAPAPVYLGNNRLFVTGGYGAGGAIIQIKEKNNKLEAVVESSFAPHEGLASEQQTPIIIGDYIYGILPKDAGSNRNQMISYRIPDLKTPVWQSGRENRFGLGPFMQINDKILILNDEGTLNMIEASQDAFKLVHQQKLFDGHDAWGPFAFADGYLLLRDSKNIYCLDLKP